MRFLEWDSEFFGHRIFRGDVERLDKATMDAISEECRDVGAECVTLLVDAGAFHQASEAEDDGFRLMDIRVTLESSVAERDHPTPAPSIRPARVGDIPVLEAIAAGSHTDTRFFADAKFAPKAPELYRTWIAQSVRGDADLVLVAETSGRPVGYFTCHRRSDSSGHIGLVGVSSSAQGRGLGRALMETALGWFNESGLHRVEVVTQGRNVAAQRLYQRSGFVTARVQLWFHKWFV